MAPTRRGKRTPATSSSTTSNSAVDTTSTTTSTTTTTTTTPGIQGLEPPKFSLILCFSLTITHIIDLTKSLSTVKSILANGGGIISSSLLLLDNDNTINTNEHNNNNNMMLLLPINATSYCVRHFQNTTEIKADLMTNNIEQIITELGCTSTDLSILNIKQQTSILRIGLCVATSILCWGDMSLLKSWNYAYAIFVTLTLSGLVFQSEFLKGNEKYSLLSMIALLLTSNRRGRQGRLRLNIKEGMFNLVLFTLVVLMSSIITSYLIQDVEDFTSLHTNDITPGGRATWFMTVVVEYSIVMIVSLFALFFFDEERKRALLVFMSIITIYHAFIQLPKQRDFWIDASTRQNYVMILFVLMVTGAVLPSFDKFHIKT